MGAGTGLIGIELQKLGYSNLHALDISPEMLKEAKKRNIYKRFFFVSDLVTNRFPKYKQESLMVLYVLVPSSQGISGQLLLKKWSGW